jgi:hypothetical protein
MPIYNVPGFGGPRRQFAPLGGAEVQKAREGAQRAQQDAANLSQAIGLVGSAINAYRQSKAASKAQDDKLRAEAGAYLYGGDLDATDRAIAANREEVETNLLTRKVQIQAANLQAPLLGAETVMGRKLAAGENYADFMAQATERRAEIKAEAAAEKAAQDRRVAVLNLAKEMAARPGETRSADELISVAVAGAEGLSAEGVKLTVQREEIANAVARGEEKRRAEEQKAALGVLGARVDAVEGNYTRRAEEVIAGVIANLDDSALISQDYTATAEAFEQELEDAAMSELGLMLGEARGAGLPEHELLKLEIAAKDKLADMTKDMAEKLDSRLAEAREEAIRSGVGLVARDSTYASVIDSARRFTAPIMSIPDEKVRDQLFTQLYDTVVGRFEDAFQSDDMVTRLGALARLGDLEGVPEGVSAKVRGAGKRAMIAGMRDLPDFTDPESGPENLRAFDAGLLSNFAEAIDMQGSALFTKEEYATFVAPFVAKARDTIGLITKAQAELGKGMDAFAPGRVGKTAAVLYHNHLEDMVDNGATPADVTKALSVYMLRARNLNEYPVPSEAMAIVLDEGTDADRKILSQMMASAPKWLREQWGSVLAESIGAKDGQVRAEDLAMGPDAVREMAPELAPEEQNLAAALLYGTNPERYAGISENATLDDHLLNDLIVRLGDKMAGKGGVTSHGFVIRAGNGTTANEPVLLAAARALDIVRGDLKRWMRSDPQTRMDFSDFMEQSSMKAMSETTVLDPLTGSWRGAAPGVLDETSWDIRGTVGTAVENDAVVYDQLKRDAKWPLEIIDYEVNGSMVTPIFAGKDTGTVVRPKTATGRDFGIIATEAYDRVVRNARRSFDKPQIGEGDLRVAETAVEQAREERYAKVIATPALLADGLDGFKGDWHIVERAFAENKLTDEHWAIIGDNLGEWAAKWGEFTQQGIGRTSGGEFVPGEFELLNDIEEEQKRATETFWTMRDEVIPRRFAQTRDALITPDLAADDAALIEEHMSWMQHLMLNTDDPKIVFDPVYMTPDIDALRGLILEWWPGSPEQSSWRNNDARRKVQAGE